MVKNITRIIIGLVLLASASWLRHKAIDLGNKSVAAPLPKDEPLPGGRADLYFGPDPDEFVKTPESKTLSFTGYALELVASAFGVVSPVLILLGSAPYILGVLRWLFIPDFMRRSRAPDACDAPDCEIAVPAVDAAVEAVGDSRSDRSLAILSQEKQDRPWRGRSSAPMSTHDSPSAPTESHEQPSGGDPPGPTRERPQ